MDRRLIQAYDKMTMPEDCTRRIEARMEQAVRANKQGKYTRVLRPREGFGAWARAAALVCLAVVIGLGGTALFLGPQGLRRAKPSELTTFTQTAPTETKDSFPHGAAGVAFLETMTRCMPDWDGYASLDDAFWTEFVVRTLNDFDSTAGWRVVTPAGEAAYAGGKVSMGKSTFADYVRLTMGCDLPDFSPVGDYGDLLTVTRDAFSVKTAALDGGDYHFRQENWYFTEENRYFDDYVNRCTATFDLCQGKQKAVAGTVKFTLFHADNENGFFILEKTTQMGGLNGTPVENQEAKAVAERFARAYFDDDYVTMGTLMSPGADLDALLKPVQEKALVVDGEKNRPMLLPAELVDTNGPDLPGGITACVEYHYQRDTTTNWTIWVDQHALWMDLQETEEGWKIRNFSLELAQGRQGGQQEIYNLTHRFLWEYFRGYDLSEFEPLTDLERLEVRQPRYPVYEGDGGKVAITKIQVYYDPTELDELTGQHIGSAWAEYVESPEEKTVKSLRLDLIRMEDGWKVVRIGEG